jgi:hypothetical protein
MLIGQQTNVAPLADGQADFAFPFDRLALPTPADFGRVQGQWNDSSAPLSVDFPVSFSTLGYTHFTHYNTPTEGKCLEHGHPATAYVFTGANCHVDTYQLNSLFIQQASLNGTGQTDSLPGLLLHTFGQASSPTLWQACHDQKPAGAHLDTGTGDGNIFVLVTPPTSGSCGKALANDATVATFPFPRSTSSIHCSDAVMLLKPGNSVESIKTVQDACPACKDGAHIDTYTSSPGCTSHDPTILDYGYFYAIRGRK